MNRNQQIRERLAQLSESSQAITARADSENRDLTEQESAQIAANIAEFERLSAELAQREEVERQRGALAQPTGRRTEPTQANTVPARPVDRRCGFESVGDYALAVIRASAKGGQLDPRLAALAPTPGSFANEGAGADGGYLVPPEFRSEIYSKVTEEDSILPRTDGMQTAGNSLVLPVDNVTPWDNNNGIQAYWEGEAAQYVASKPQLETQSIRLHKLIALVPATEELLDDAPAMTSYIRRKAPEKMRWKINFAIMQGTGVGQPLGALKSKSTISIPKESGQAADSLVYENIMKMWTRMYAPARRNAAWMINQDIEPQLYALRFLIKNVAGTENVGGFPVFMPGGTVANAPYGTLMGRPIIPTETCETLGDKGDIVLVDWSRYLTVQKTTGIRSDMSMHLWFDYDLMAFKFTFRMAGMPWWKTPVTPRDSSNTLSWCVTLDERA